MSGIKIHGSDRLDRKLRELSEAVAKEALAKAVEKGTEIVREEIRRRAPVGEGGLKRSVTSHMSKRTRYEAQGKVGFTGEGAHAHLVEFGTAPRVTDDGAYRGAMPARPFIRPAWDAKKRQAYETILDELRARVQRVAK